ncbi:MAG TPA: DUF5916 domain-containing protein [Chitinophagaceae bacterium]|nr:DUF5916 domain-containing protein [Chitinophagaceae bacterium]
MRNPIPLLLVVCICNSLLAQQPSPRQLEAKRTSQPVKIDGLLKDEAWKDAAIMDNLVEFRPKVGDKEDPANRTLAYLMYNDEGIYFGGYCYERSRDSIASELAGRDGFGTNDYVGIIFDTYYDKLNGFEYFVTPLNEQWDAKMSPNPNGNSEDFSWSAVWESGAVIHNDGWSFEMFIPYSAIRFGKKEVQTWGINITRRRRKTEEQFTWNPIDPNISGFLTQEGTWTGIANIKPPMRLQFSPYFSTYANHYPYSKSRQENWSGQVNGGMDVKYGINQAFTLDVTLIPDFGQVQSDNRVLNLTPFEVKYTENRPFFTEGTELFSKGNLFYPRRIGLDPVLLHSPREYYSPNEITSRVSTESKLINASKVSGRTNKGLGIGFLNAITNTRYAVLQDTLTKGDRKVMIDPLTNYNVLVLDQTLKNNSSVSLVNTNVWRSGSDYDANVTAGLFSINDKTNTWNVSGKLANSRRIGYNGDGTTRSGYSHSVSVGKISGRFNFNLGQEFTDTKYSSNDLAYFTFNNYLDHNLWIGYRWLKPTNWYNNLRFNLNAYYSRQVKPGAYRSANFNTNVNGQLKNLWFVGAMVGYEPSYNDFNEPRREGWVFKGWKTRFVDVWFESNQSKKYSVYTEILYINRSYFKSTRYQVFFNQRFRFNDKFSLSHRLNMEPQWNNVGFAAIEESTDKIIFGLRDRNTIENILSIKYNFNSRMGLNTKVRHYWSKVDYQRFFTLLQSGQLEENPDFNENKNLNVNYFNIDMVYTWQFAPGSFLNIVWKNSITDFSPQVEKGYFKNLGNTVEADQNNNLSLKVIYFLDYIDFRKWSKKKRDS